MGTTKKSAAKSGSRAASKASPRKAAAKASKKANKAAGAETMQAVKPLIRVRQARAFTSKKVTRAELDAITEVARGRILHSRKLDEFLDIIHNRGDKTTYFVWLERFSVAKPRATRRGGPSTGGAMAFQGFSESTEFSKITKLRDAIRKDPFFEDFTRITRPIFKAVDFDDDLEPKSAGRFQFTMELKPLGWQYAKKKPSKGKR